MTILLTTLNAKYIHLNLAIRILYELNKKHEGLQWKEFTIKEDKDQIADFCKQFDVVAFSCYIWNITQTLEVAKKLKELNPGIKILLGGPEVSYDWDNVMSRDEVDYIIVGEGEIAFEQFLQHTHEPEKVPGLVWKKDGQVFQNPMPAAYDLKLFEGINPYINDPVADLLNKVLYIETSRGCPYKCEFCLASLDNKVRYLPDSTIKQNLLYLMQHGRVIKFLDRTFNIKKDFTIGMFQFILDHHRPENVFQFEITADIVHPDIVKFIQEHVPEGLFRFEIGIQTVNQKANLEVSRKQNFEKTSAVIKSLDNKVEMHLDLIVGLPLDEMADIKHSIEEVFKLYPPELQLGFLKFLKGTPVREKYEQYGFEFDPNPPYQIIRSNYLSAEELKEITLLEEALEIYWNKKRAPLALRYIAEKYGITGFLFGLGKHFDQQVGSFHQYTMLQVYQTITTFVEHQYPADKVLIELIAADYYLHHKVKPQTLFLQEPDTKEKYALLETLKLNYHNNRYLVFPFSFDLHEFIKSKQLISVPTTTVFEYTGTGKPQYFTFSTSQVLH